MLSPKGPGTVAWPFFDAQFDVVRGISLPDTCLPWLRAEITGDDGDPSDESGWKTAAFCMHPDVEELGTAGVCVSFGAFTYLGLSNSPLVQQNICGWRGTAWTLRGRPSCSW